MLTVVALLAFAAVIWVQHRNHQADYAALVALAIRAMEPEPEWESDRWEQE